MWRNKTEAKYSSFYQKILWNKLKNSRSKSDKVIKEGNNYKCFMKNYFSITEPSVGTAKNLCKLESTSFFLRIIQDQTHEPNSYKISSRITELILPNAG